MALQRGTAIVALGALAAAAAAYGAQKILGAVREREEDFLYKYLLENLSYALSWHRVSLMTAAEDSVSAAAAKAILGNAPGFTVGDHRSSCTVYFEPASLTDPDILYAIVTGDEATIDMLRARLDDRWIKPLWLIKTVDHPTEFPELHGLRLKLQVMADGAPECQAVRAKIAAAAG